MIRNAASKVMWVGRATVFLVGLAVILALVFGVATSAMGANGDSFVLGKKNVASAISTLVKQGAGPALKLQVGAGQPPMAVNSTAKVARLNADRIDNREAGSFANGVGGVATNADKLDGKDWQSEAWHEVGAPGEPAFYNFYDGGIRNYGGSFNTAGFYKDSSGIVHLKGLVKSTASWNSYYCSNGGTPLFELPAGYRPAQQELHATVMNDGIGRVDIRAYNFTESETWWVAACLPTGLPPNGWISLDGITFRTAN